MRPLGRAAAEGTSPRAHWIGPELCGQGEGMTRVMRTMQIGECHGMTTLPGRPSIALRH